MLAGLALAVVAKPSVGQKTAPDPTVWTVPEIGALPNDAHGRLVRRGRDLITATYALIGPLVANHAKRYAGNNPACASCHLQAATKVFGLPLFGLAGDYPRDRLPCATPGARRRLGRGSLHGVAAAPAKTGPRQGSP